MDCNPLKIEDTWLAIKRIIQVKAQSPKRPPRLIILGPPGSGRATQARAISKWYGLVHISTMNLLRNEISKKTERGQIISESIKKGELVPDDLIMSIIENWIKKTDCRVNGWVMDGFPKTLQQVHLLKSINIKPSRVILLECSEETSVARLQQRRIDPITGIYYSMDNLPHDPEIKEWLLQHDEDKEEVVRKRWRVWDEFIGWIEEIYHNLLYVVKTESQTSATITDILSEVVQNPARR